MVNHEGELVTFCLTKGNVDDHKVVPMLMKNFKGLAAATKAIYLGQELADKLQQHELKLITNETALGIKF